MPSAARKQKRPRLGVSPGVLAEQPLAPEKLFSLAQLIPSLWFELLFRMDDLCGPSTFADPFQEYCDS